MGLTSLLDGSVRVDPLLLRSSSSKSVLPVWCCLGRWIALVVLKKKMDCTGGNTYAQTGHRASSLLHLTCVGVHVGQYADA